MLGTVNRYAPELVEGGFAVEVADAPLLHDGLNVADVAHVLVLESMKMETVVQAPFAGRVRELLVKTGSQVENGAPLLRLEPVADETEAEPDAGAGADLELPAAVPEAAAVARAAAGLVVLRTIMLGYDTDHVADLAQRGAFG